MKLARTFDSAMRRARTTWALVAAAALGTALALSSVSAPPAHADPYPIDGGPDTGTHTFCFAAAYPFSSALVSRARYSMDNNDGVEAQTTVNTQEYADCGTEIDVRFQDVNLGTGNFGYSPCSVRLANGRCGRRDVQVNWGYIQNVAGDPGYQARKTLCHEIGHTLGANHYYEDIYNPDGYFSPHSCLRTGLFDSGAAWTRTYGPDHRAHINLWF